MAQTVLWFLCMSVKWRAGGGHRLLTDNLQIFLLIFSNSSVYSKLHRKLPTKASKSDLQEVLLVYSCFTVKGPAWHLRTITALKSQWMTLKATISTCLVFLEALLNLSYRIASSASLSSHGCGLRVQTWEKQTQCLKAAGFEVQVL